MEFGSARPGLLVAGDIKYEKIEVSTYMSPIERIHDFAECAQTRIDSRTLTKSFLIVARMLIALAPSEVYEVHLARDRSVVGVVEHGHSDGEDRM